MRYMTLIVMTVLATWLLGTSAAEAQNAATASNVQGQVSFNRGDGFRRLANGNQLTPGDRVLVGEGGSVRVQFSNLCDVVFSQPGTYIVPPNPTCAGGSFATTGAVPAGVATVTIIGAGAAIYFATKPASP